MHDAVPPRRGARAARHLERVLALLVCAGGLPAVAVAGVFLWHAGVAPEVKWTLLAAIVGAWLAAMSYASAVAARALDVIANLLGALREGDYSMRGLTASSGSAMALVMREVNDLGTTLQRQRSEAVESTALLTHVLEEIAVGVFAFDPANHLLLVNKAGAALLGAPASRLVGLPASALGFDEYLTGDPRRLVDRAFGGR